MSASIKHQRHRNGIRHNLARKKHRRRAVRSDAAARQHGGTLSLNLLAPRRLRMPRAAAPLCVSDIMYVAAVKQTRNMRSAHQRVTRRKQTLMRVRRACAARHNNVTFAALAICRGACVNITVRMSIKRGNKTRWQRSARA